MAKEKLSEMKFLNHAIIDGKKQKGKEKYKSWGQLETSATITLVQLSYAILTSCHEFWYFIFVQRDGKDERRSRSFDHDSIWRSDTQRLNEISLPQWTLL